jgi:hypothetical protein
VPDIIRAVLSLVGHNPFKVVPVQVDFSRVFISPDTSSFL